MHWASTNGGSGNGRCEAAGGLVRVEMQQGWDEHKQADGGVGVHRAIQGRQCRQGQQQAGTGQGGKARQGRMEGPVGVVWALAGGCASSPGGDVAARG
jgi:hypothetical protein